MMKVCSMEMTTLALLQRGLGIQTLVLVRPFDIYLTCWKFCCFWSMLFICI